jgi:Tol biopolymer transport system component
MEPESPGYEGISLNGRYRSFVDWETGDLAIHELATGKTWRLTKKTNNKDFSYPMSSLISPESKLVAYGWAQNENLDLHLVEIDGSNPRVLYTHKGYRIFPISWTSNGKQIACIRANANDKTKEIVWVSVSDGSIRIIKQLEGEKNPACASHSPDDRYIAYDYPVKKDSENFDIFLLATDGSVEIPLIQHPANDRLIGWIPGRNDIMFISDRSGTWDAWIIHIVEGKPQGSPERIKAGIGQIWPLGLTQDGLFYFSIFTRKATIQIAPLDPATSKIQEELSQPLLGSNFMPEWSPDGEYLAYISEQEEIRGPGFYHRPLQIKNLKTGEVRELASEIEARSPSWSPDGLSILVTGYDSKRSEQKDYNGGVYKIDVKDGHATPLVEFDSEWWPNSVAEWTHDGMAFYYINGGKLALRDIPSGQEKQLYSNSHLTRKMDLSPDGQWLVLGLEDREKVTFRILIMPSLGGEVKELLKLEKGGRIAGVKWTPDGKFVHYTKPEKKGSSWWRISRGGGEPQKISQSKKNLVEFSSIHPQGYKIAFGYFEQATEHWVMENFIPIENSQKK